MAAAVNSTDLNLIAFDIIYLTRTVNLDPARKKPVEEGLICYSVYAKNAEDAIARLRAQEPIKHPIIEIARVNPAPDLSDGSLRSLEYTILPPGMLPLAAVVGGH